MWFYMFSPKLEQSTSLTSSNSLIFVSSTDHIYFEMSCIFTARSYCLVKNKVFCSKVHKLQNQHIHIISSFLKNMQHIPVSFCWLFVKDFTCILKWWVSSGSYSAQLIITQHDSAEEMLHLFINYYIFLINFFK